MAQPTNLCETMSLNGVKATPQLISDGKRMRVVWTPSNGDGDSSAHLVARSMNLIRGHPTWKIFTGVVDLPIVRGSTNEPPHYVYLDDRACYAIYCSKAYSHQELREFYAWDFNHQGHIKQGRLNRGNPAYLDDSNTVFAQGRLRGKDKWYTFAGAPEVTKYQPLRPKKESKIGEEVVEEYAEQIARGVKPRDIFTPQAHKAVEPPTSPGAKIVPASTLKTPPRGTNEKLSQTSCVPIPMEVPSLSSSTYDSTCRVSPVYHPKPVRLPPAPLTGNPYGDNSPSTPHGNALSSTGRFGRFDLVEVAAVDTSRSAAEATPVHNSLLKRQFVSTAGFGSPKKRIQRSPDLGGDGAHYDDDYLGTRESSDSKIVRKRLRWSKPPMLATNPARDGGPAGEVRP